MTGKPLSELMVRSADRRVGSIRNLWFLLMYAPECASFGGPLDRSIDGPAELLDVLARLLVFATERRLRRSLSRAYQPRSAALARVRGRIDVLQTECKYRHQARFACRFEELTHDNPRNRYARAALEHLARDVRDPELAHRCRSLARTLLRLGISDECPSEPTMRRVQISRHDSDDRLMISAARSALRRTLPSERDGLNRATDLVSEGLLPKIFESAVAGFYRHELGGRDGWSVRRQKQLDWPAADPTEQLAGRLPRMKADVLLENAALRRRIVIETKFTDILAPGQHGKEVFESAHICQLYAYLRSQCDEGDGLANRAEGILLYPVFDHQIDAAATMQGHGTFFYHRSSDGASPDTPQPPRADPDADLTRT